MTGIIPEHRRYIRILQDSKDFIWIGTGNGVSRFDGKKFINYTTRDSLAAGGVWSIFEDTQGLLWFGHLNGGLSVYDGKLFRKCYFDTIKITGDISGIIQADDKIWFTTTSDGAIMVKYPVDSINAIKGRQFLGEEGLSYMVNEPYVLKDGSLVCNIGVGELRKYDPEKERFDGYRMPNMTTYFGTSCMLEDSAGDLWFGTHKGGLYRYLMDKNQMIMYDLVARGLSSNFVTCLTEDKKGNVWVGTYKGDIAVFKGENIDVFDESNGLKGVGIITNIIEDKEGNILISAHESGILIYKGDAFSSITDKESLPDLNIKAVYKQADGTLWFGTNMGLTKYNPATAWTGCNNYKPEKYNTAGY